MKMVFLAARERYTNIDCILCVDRNPSPSQASQILQLQTGITGDLCLTQVHFVLSTLTSLSCCLAEIILSSVPKANSMTTYQQKLADRDIVCRASFLISLLPTMTVEMALIAVGSDNPREGLQLLLRSELERQKICAVARPSDKPRINPKAMIQLSHVLQANLSTDEMMP